MDTLQTTAYWVARPGGGELRAGSVPAAPAPGRSLLRTAYSGVSAGTERLVGLGLVPPECEIRMRCRSMEGSFALPVKYGYALVGDGVAGALAGRRVFVMHPHQDLVEVADGDALLLPDGIPPPRATLIPNLETALNAVWDAELRKDERCVVLGGGIVGVLLAYVLRRQGTVATLVESAAPRRKAAEALPWIRAAVAPEDLPAGAATVAFHATGRPEGLARALAAVGFEGRVIDLSWYGWQPVTLDLGGSFHFDRKRIIASQVAAVAPARRATHGPRERLAEVLELLARPELDALPSAPVPFTDMPAFMARVYRGDPVPAAPLIAYRATP